MQREHVIEPRKSRHRALNRRPGLAIDDIKSIFVATDENNSIAFRTLSFESSGLAVLPSVQDPALFHIDKSGSSLIFSMGAQIVDIS